MPKQSYTVGIYVNGNIIHNILQVQAESAEEAEDIASEEITLKATRAYDKKTEEQEFTTEELPESGSLPETEE